jgi:hypothetical protein
MVSRDLIIMILVDYLFSEAFRTSDFLQLERVVLDIDQMWDHCACHACHQGIVASVFDAHTKIELSQLCCFGIDLRVQGRRSGFIK